LTTNRSEDTIKDGSRCSMGGESKPNWKVCLDESRTAVLILVDGKTAMSLKLEAYKAAEQSFAEISVPTERGAIMVPLRPLKELEQEAERREAAPAPAPPAPPESAETDYKIKDIIKSGDGTRHIVMWDKQSGKRVETVPWADFVQNAKDGKLYRDAKPCMDMLGEYSLARDGGKLYEEIFGAPYIPPRKPHPLRKFVNERPLVAWGASVAAALLIGWAARYLLSPRPVLGARPPVKSIDASDPAAMPELIDSRLQSARYCLTNYQRLPKRTVRAMTEQLQADLEKLQKAAADMELPKQQTNKLNDLGRMVQQLAEKGEKR